MANLAIRHGRLSAGKLTRIVKNTWNQLGEENHGKHSNYCGSLLLYVVGIVRAVLVKPWNLYWIGYNGY